MHMPQTYSFQSPKEEFYNFLTHGIGAVLSIVGLLILVFTAKEASFLSYFSVSLYGGSMILLFSASSIYHYVSDEGLKRGFRKLDHISIYYLIAGTYTPVSLLLLKEKNGFLLFGIVWTMAILGTFLKLFFIGKWEKLSLAIYLIMGWLIVFNIHNLWEVANFNTLLYLGLGGAFYSMGAFFYAKHSITFNHVIWHIFVLLGAFFHYLMVLEVI